MQILSAENHIKRGKRGGGGGGVIVYRQESEGHIKLWLVSQSYKAGTNDFHCVYRSSLALFMASSSVVLRLMSAS